MRVLFAAVFTLLAIVATGFSFIGTREAQWEGEQTLTLSVFNFLLVAPLWFVAMLLSSWPTKRGVLGSVVFSLGLAAFLTFFQTSAFRAQDISGKFLVCQNRLKSIGRALQQYEQHYGCFPPAYIADANGKPMHSWRVLLLPFIEGGEEVYRQYSFKEPWDGPNNRKLIGTRIMTYSCPVDSNKGDHTSYVAVVGPGTAWPGAKSTRTSDMGDGPNRTILIAEVADSGINWTEPRDIAFDQMDFHINGTARNAISSCHRGNANVLMADCCVRSLRDTLPPETVRALLTIAGGEAIPDDVVEH
jgi:hypothetical protein